MRIKILKLEGLDWAEHFVAGSADITIRGKTFNLENGKIVESEVDKKDMFDEKATKYVENKSFSFPNVKEGSIIEYTFEVNYGSFRKIMPWYFQYDIPVMYSEYRVELPEPFEYKRIMTGYIALDEAQTESRNGTFQGSPIRIFAQRYVATNIPAFRKEAGVPAPDDYKSKISFELNVISVPGQPIRYFMPKSYGHLSRHLATTDMFEKEMNKGKIVEEQVAELVSGLDSDEEKVRAIYSWVQENFTVDTEFYEDNYKKIFEERKGFAEDINFILLMMMKQAGCKAEPVLISTRAHGKVHPFYPSEYNFNHMLGLITAGENSWLLDASDKLLPFNAIGEKCLNGNGLVISENEPRWVELNPSFQNLKYISSELELDTEGNLKGQMKLSRKGYEAIGFRRDNMESKDDYVKSFSQSLANWTINSHVLEGLEEKKDYINEEIQIEIPDYAQSMGDVIYVNPVVFGGMKENPYKSEKREYPVSYPAPIKEITSFSITIPEGYVVEETPQPVAIALPENAGKFIFSVSSNGRIMNIASQFMLNKTEFLPEEYPILRQFYAQIVAKQSEQVVLKKEL
jgi:transglutaminase-like putative cysteine protease